MSYLIKKAVSEEAILEVYIDNNADSPRERENIGTMVCWHSRYNLGDKHSFKTPRDFYEFLIMDFVGTDSWDKVIERYADREVRKFEIVQVEDGYIIQRDGWNPFYGYVYESSKEAEFELEEYRQELINEPELEELTDEDLWDIFSPHVVILPLYLYDHSGITMSTGPFNDPWDSGQVGWICATKKKLLRETGYTEDELFKEGRAVEILRAEVKEYDQYLRGDVYGFVFYELDTDKLNEYMKLVNVKLSDLSRAELKRFAIEKDSCWGLYGYEHLKEAMTESIPEKYHYLFDSLTDREGYLCC